MHLLLAMDKFCWWISCRKNTGYHTKDLKDSNAGGYTREI
jgi:hypothetical protein